MNTSFDTINMKSNLPPHFNWTPDRWAVARTNNVEKLHRHWKDDPNRVAILEDPKFNNEKLVILKKEHLDHLLYICETLSKSYSENISSTKILLKTIDLVSELANSKPCDDTIKNAFSILRSIRDNLTHELDKQSPCAKN